MNSGTLWLLAQEIKRDYYDQLINVSKSNENISEKYDDILSELKTAVEKENAQYSNKNNKIRLTKFTTVDFYDMYFYSFFYKIVTAIKNEKIITNRVLFKSIDEYYEPNLDDYDKLKSGLTIPSSVSKESLIEKIKEKKQLLKETDKKLSQIFIKIVEDAINDKDLSYAKNSLIELKYNYYFLDNESETELLNLNNSKENKSIIKKNCYSNEKAKQICDEYIEKIFVSTANKLLNLSDEKYQEEIIQKKVTIMDIILKTSVALLDENSINKMKQRIETIINSQFYKQRQKDDIISKQIIMFDLKSAESIKEKYIKDDNDIVRKRK